MPLEKDALEVYRSKRKFAATPEPEPGAISPSAGELKFCVQRHHATRLHYDLRLEVGGVLKSWAVPKGPTLDPADKRLAMMTEDHPMEYASFEGVIPKGNYGAGSMMLWDEGVYEVLTETPVEQQLARGDFKFHLRGSKVAGDFALVKIKSSKANEWLLLKKKDAHAKAGWDTEALAVSVASGRTQEEIAQGLVPVKAAVNSRTLPKGAVERPMPREITPMLAEIGKGPPPKGDGWLHEVKWDGVRSICYIENGRARLVSRNGNGMDRQYPELSVLPHHVKARNAILDAEIAALDAKGVPSFETLQRRIHVDDAGAIAALARSSPVVMFVFDLLYLDGYDLRGLQLAERKKLLREILEPDEHIRYSQEFPGHGAGLLEAVKQQGIEGIVSKRAASFYESRRSQDWLKFKVTESASFVLCGYTHGEREGFGALVLGIYDRKRLLWAGNVGTGFDARGVKAILEKLNPLCIDICPVEHDKNLPKPGTVVWTKPQLVCEVKFANWTADGRLRAPVFLGLRADIDPSECRKDAGDEARPVLLTPDLAEANVTVDGHRLKFTNLGKVFYPVEKYTKRDLLNYYDAVAPLLLPHLKDRPLSLKRYPNGIDHDFFFQKEVAESFPKWLRTGVADDVRHVIGDNRATLLFLVNLGCIDHNPWMSRMGALEHPDYMLIDLDPHECGYAKIVEAALLVKARLDAAELVSYPKTTGGDGMHIFVPLEPRYTYEQVRSFAEMLCTLVVAERPQLFTTARAVAKRQKDRVYFDWAQIAQGKTISAPYVARAYAGAPVATPLEWHEVKPGLEPGQFTIANVLRRFDRVGDLFAGVLVKPQSLETAVEKLMAKLR